MRDKAPTAIRDVLTLDCAGRIQDFLSTEALSSGGQRQQKFSPCAPHSLEPVLRLIFGIECFLGLGFRYFRVLYA